MISRKIKDKKIGKDREKRKAKMKFSLNFKIPGKLWMKNWGQEIEWKKKNKTKRTKRNKNKINGKSQSFKTIGWRLFKR